MILVRAAHQDDADALWAIDRACLADGRGMVRTLGEAAPDAATAWSRRTLDDDHALFVAEHDDRVVGEVSVSRFALSFLRHVATLAVQVHPDVQGRGIGRALMEAGIAQARAWGSERLQLYVRADNDRAIALYRSLGFAIESTRARFLRLPDGRSVDDHVMVRFLTP